MNAMDNMKAIAERLNVNVKLERDKYHNIIAKVGNTSFTVKNYLQFERELIKIIKIKEVTKI